jgi:hypothetical protein
MAEEVAKKRSLLKLLSLSLSLSFSLSVSGGEEERVAEGASGASDDGRQESLLARQDHHDLGRARHLSHHARQPYRLSPD